jgi:uncharacterized protein
VNERAALRRLEQVIAPLGSALVAFSGGVDSSVVAAAAYRALGQDAIAVTAVSDALATGELETARQVAAAIGIRHRAIRTHELDREGYRANGADRCFHCKSELYDALDALASANAGTTVLSGANVDDLGDWRPGLAAAGEHGVRHPLVEAGIAKAQVRAIAASLGLPSAAKPASPCLASRVPYGTPVDAPTLACIDRAERAVKQLGYADVRVRHLGSSARIELPDADLPRALEEHERARIETAVRHAGYDEAHLSVAPLRSGSLSAVFLGLPVDLTTAQTG